MIKPRLWQHKETKKTFKVLPWWEVPDELDLGVQVLPGRSTKIGIVVQIGWLIENEGGVWLGVNLSGAEYFDDITPMEPVASEAHMATSGVE